MRSVGLLSSIALGLVLFGACGDPPAPAAVSQEFDDPFAEEAAPAAPAATAAPAGEASPAGEGPTEVVADGVAGEGVASEGAAAEVDSEASAAAEAALPTAAAPPAAAVAEAAASATEPAPTRSTASKKPSAGPVPSASRPSKPDPSDSPAEAAPTPAPVVEPAPAPAPVAAKDEPKPAPAAPPPPAQLRFAGTYRFAGGASQRAEVEAAIEAAAQQVNAVIRGIARKRLTESNPIREQIVIAVDGERVTVTFAAGRTVSGVLGGPAVDWTSDSGKPVKVGFSLVKGRLVLNFTAEDGGRRSTFTLNEAGDRLTMSVTITSERLTTPMKYALSYRRS